MRACAAHSQTRGHARGHRALGRGRGHTSAQDGDVMVERASDPAMGPQPSYRLAQRGVERRRHAIEARLVQRRPPQVAQLLVSRRHDRQQRAHAALRRGRLPRRTCELVASAQVAEPARRVCEHLVPGRAGVRDVRGLECGHEHRHHARLRQVRACANGHTGTYARPVGCECPLCVRVLI
eukprot:3360150-Prymnesium_polylepis.1